MREIRRLEHWAYSAQAMNKQLAGPVLLTRKGYGHVSYNKSECVKQAVDAYLIDLTLPAPGTVCESDGCSCQAGVSASPELRGRPAPPAAPRTASKSSRARSSSTGPI